MGIHTDYSTVGNFGSETRMDYTIIAGGVNTASRLENLVRPDEILISYETYAHVRDEISCAELGPIEVKGIAHPVVAYRVLELRQNHRQGARDIEMDLPHLTLNADVNRMSPARRQRAAAALREAANQLWTSEN